MFPTDTSAAIDTTPIDTALETDAIDTSLDTSTDTTDTTDTTTDDTAIDDPTAEPEPETGEPFKGRVIENGKINPAAKPLLDKLKAESPALAKQVMNALHRQDAMNREFPGGVQAIKAKIGQLESTIQGLGGADGIKSTKEELQFFHDLDQQFTAGDPRFVESLIASPEGQSSFLKLAPALIEKYAAMHPEGFDAYIAGKFKSEIERHDVKLGLVRMADFIERLPEGPERNGILQQWNQLVGFHNEVLGKASKKPELPKIEGSTPAKQDDTRETALTQRETQIKQQEYGITWKSELTSVVNPELNRLRTERGFNANTEAAIQELFASRFAKVVAAKAQNASRFFKAGDMAGYQKAVRQLFREEAPKTLAAIVDHFAPAKAGRKAAAPGAPAKPGAPGAQLPKVAPEAGWTVIRGKPDASLIDYDKTRALPGGGYSAGMAIYKDGRKVKFAR